jgi:rod shape-determining protein MreB
MRFRSSVAIDLGTVNTLVWVAGRGIVLEEPTAIAIDTAVGKVAAVGAAADALADKEPQDIEVIHPLRDGVIADLDATAAMLHDFLRRSRRFGVLRPNALVCVPSGATPVERRSIVAALGVRRPRYNVRLIDEPVAAAAGAGFDLTGGAGGFVVDIGGGTTEVAAVAGWRVVRARSLRKAGNAMDEAIMHAIRSEMGLIISQRAARQLKMTLGVTGGAEGWAEAVGIDAGQRTPRTDYVPGGLVATALEPLVATIAAAVHEMLSEIPAGLAEDVVRGKIRLAGGGSLLPGLAARIETAAGIGAVLVEDPLRCVVRGAAEILERRGDLGKHGGPGLRQLAFAAGRAPGFVCYSRGWREMTAGSRPASSQPMTAAATGMPTRMNSRFSVGTWDSADRPSSLLSQP